MENLDRVIKGLECCEGANEHTHCAICPYYKECSDWVLAGGKPAPLIRDALAILKALATSRQARVIRKDELGSLPGGSVVWLDQLPERNGYVEPTYPICFERARKVTIGINKTIWAIEYNSGQHVSKILPSF